jgi:spore coat polysaccharide biosynthesis predicted glycosyltransferase SpsG
MSAVGVWFDGGGQYGFGNIRRSIEMALELKRRGHDVFATAMSDVASGLSECPMETPPKLDAVLLDLPYPGDEAVERAQSVGAKVVALDYEGRVAPDVAISLQGGRSIPHSTRSYVGVEYAIIRSEFRSLKDRKPSVEEVLVILGGGDFQGLSQEIVLKLGSVPVCVVQGPVAKPLEIRGSRLRILNSPAELPELMSMCRWAVTSGGTTMLEMLFLGKAIHVVARTEAETRFARQFLEKGAILGLGLDTLREPDIEQIRYCEERGADLIDDLGAERIAEILEESL